MASAQLKAEWSSATGTPGAQYVTTVGVGLMLALPVDSWDSLMEVSNVELLNLLL